MLHTVLQYNIVVRTVRQKSGWVLRTFYSRRTDLLKQLWKSLLQCHIDYCSQLFKPAGQSSDMIRLEKLFYDYSAKIPEVRNTNYWQRLKRLKMLSQERRMERYRVIYMWKILEGKVPNCGVEEAPASERRGRRVAVPALRPGGRRAAQTLREQGFQTDGARLFNSLPRNLREIRRDQEAFKEALDQHLARIPDQPRIGGLVPEAVDQQTGKQSNSLLAWGTTTGDLEGPTQQY